MDECRRWSREIWRLAILPVLLVALVPLAILLALALYLRALVLGVWELAHGLKGRRLATERPLPGPHRRSKLGAFRVREKKD